MTDTPVRTLRETFELGPVDHQDADVEHRRAYDSVPRRTGWHRLAVDIEDGPERAFPFHPPYGKQEGFAVSIQAEDGITGGVGGVSCG